MNLYFLSLLKVDRERRKNVACFYKLDLDEDNKIKKASSYLLSRYPFLQNGDMILDGNNIRFWDGKKMKNHEKRIRHPFFFSYSNPNFELRALFCDSERLSKCDYERKEKIFGLNIFHLLIRNFKIGKTRYDLLVLSKEIVSFFDDEFFYLESRLRHPFSYRWFLTTLNDKKESDEYVGKYKKRLFILV
jgi:hypothetical protein